MLLPEKILITDIESWIFYTTNLTKAELSISSIIDMISTKMCQFYKKPKANEPLDGDNE